MNRNTKKGKISLRDPVRKMRKLKILIVDFDEEASRYLSEFLKTEGFEVSEAVDGEIGLEKCKAEMPDLVVVEPMISKLHGFELCSIVTNDYNGKIPVVILTKFYREEQFKIEAMRSYGAAAFLSKPFKGPDILETIRDLLKDKIKEDEEEEMAEDIQELEEISDTELEALEINVPNPKSQDQVDVLDEEPHKSMAFPQEEPQPKTERVYASKIDKMLEDTLSEFGLNINKKEKPKAEEKIEFQAKMDALVEELKNGKKIEDSETLEPKTKKPTVRDSGITPEIKKEAKEFKAEEPEIAEMGREERGRENSDIEQLETQGPKVKEPESPPAKMPDMTGGAKDKPEKEIQGEKSIFAAEIEEKEKGPILKILKNSILFLKKHPLKFLIPGALVAALAVSASFVFRKPSRPIPFPKQTPEAVQQVTSQDMAPLEKMAIENPGNDEESNSTSAVKEEAKEPAEDATGTDQGTQDTSVKTRVSQVFQVQEPESKPKPDLNAIDISKAVISTDLSEELAAPLLTENEPEHIPSENTESSVDTGTDMAAQNSSEEATSTAPQEETDNPSPFEKPKTKLGDLVPMSEVDIPPEIARRVEPKYPSYALSRGVGGKVILNVLIDEKGDVIEVALLRGIKGPYGFDEECENAIKQWKFVPAFKDGIKVKVWKTISFTFQKS